MLTHFITRIIFLLINNSSWIISNKLHQHWNENNLDNLWLTITWKRWHVKSVRSAIFTPLRTRTWRCVWAFRPQFTIDSQNRARIHTHRNVTNGSEQTEKHCVWKCNNIWGPPHAPDIFFSDEASCICVEASVNEISDTETKKWNEVVAMHKNKLTDGKLS